MREFLRRASGLGLMASLAACGGNASPRVQDPIPDIPDAQQRTATRSEFGWRWPFSVGTGTLACASGAVVFRSAGRSYAVNDAARSRGFAPVEPIWEFRSSGPPRNPLARLTQHQRTQIFAAAAACETDSCKQRLRVSHGLSEAELRQIEAEGQERRWPPLPRMRKDLAPLVGAGLKLCQG